MSKSKSDKNYERLALDSGILFQSLGQVLLYNSQNQAVLNNLSNKDD
jgi:hypothetical protein